MATKALKKEIDLIILLEGSLECGLYILLFKVKSYFFSPEKLAIKKRALQFGYRK